jgi:hypothetical protein
MDKELVEQVTKLVLETLEEMKGSSDFNNQQAVKIWSHQSPLPDPIILDGENERESKAVQKKIIITPYR